MALVPTLDYAEGHGPSSYWKLVRALENLLDDQPESEELRARREEADAQGQLHPISITQLNVAIESGSRSRRKLISGEKSSFPKLAAYITSLRSTHGVVANTTERLRRQAEDIATLDQKVRVLRSQVLAALKAKDDAETELREAQDQIARLKKRVAA